MNWTRTLIICAGVVLAAVGALTLIYSSEPTAERTTAVRQTAMLVEVIEAEIGTFRPVISAVGSVRPEKEIMLSPRVSGEIVAVGDGFRPGGFVEKGELLVQIDSADYEATLIEAEAQLHQAQANFELELGRRELARSDYEDLKGTISSEYRTLVLREPQLNAAEAVVEAAEAAVQRARLNLERTQIRATFDAQVLTREANVGSQIAPGQTLARLVGTEQYWVEVAVPSSDVRWIGLPERNDAMGSAVSVRNRTAWPQGLTRNGYVESLIGSLERETRLARVLVTIPDPLAHQPESEGLPPLMVGSFVEATIEGKPIENVVRIHRNYLRKDDTVWVKKDGRLDIREVVVEFLDRDYAYIRSGLDAGELVVTTNLASVIPGAELRLKGDEATAP